MHPDEGTGLVCAGGVHQSFLARMPALLRHLGPIKASHSPVARKVARALRAGYATSDYSALEPCGLILVRVPELKLEITLRDMAVRTPIRKAPDSCNIVVLCDCVRDSLAPSALASTGARVATLNSVPGSNERLFVAEGHAAAIRRIRSLLEDDHRKLITLKPRTKPLFFAGIQASSPLLLPWMAAGVASLRAAGFSRAQAARVGEALGTRAIRRYAKGGAKTWTPEAAAELRRALEHEVPQIRSGHPQLADLYEQGIRLALGQF